MQATAKGFFAPISGTDGAQQTGNPDIKKTTAPSSEEIGSLIWSFGKHS